MEWKDISSAIGKAAPLVGGLLGGPAGAAVGSLVSAALGVENTPESVQSALANNPDAIVKLQELQTNAKVQLQQLAVTAEQNRMQAELLTFQAEAADRDSARALAAKTPHDWIRPTITILLIVLVAVVVYCVFSGVSEAIMRDPTASVTIGVLIGYLFNELKQVLAFYFGTTKESTNQNHAITSFAVSPGTVTSGNDDGN